MRLISLITLMLIFQFGKSATKQLDTTSKAIEMGTTIMQEVFTRFHSNYEMSRVNKMGYYQESVSDSGSIYYFAEGIVDIYIPSNLNQTDNAAIYPIKTRKKADKEIEDDKMLFGNASDMARSSIWRPNSFLNRRNRENYIFSYVGETKLRSYDVTIIEFAPAEGSHGNVRGKIYIDRSYYGIVKIEYTPLIAHSKVWKEVSWTENFEFRRGAYELINVKFEGISSADQFFYEAFLVMDQAETVHQIPTYILFMGDDAPLFAKAKEISSDSFWEGFEFLKSEFPNAEIT